MDDPGPSRRHGIKDRKRQLASSEENPSNDSRSAQEMKLDPPVSKMKLREPSIKNFMEGASYQISLTIINLLLSYKTSMSTSTDIGVAVEHPDFPNDKFDDIVVSLKDGVKKEKVKIQAKSHGKELIKNDFTTMRVSDSPFALWKYISSYVDCTGTVEVTSTEDEAIEKSDLALFTVITDATMKYDNDLKEIWNPVKPEIMEESDLSSISVDSYAATLFKSIKGICYQLDYNYAVQLWRQCSKAVRLARLLVENIKTIGKKDKITRGTPLFKEFRSAILFIIDKEEGSSDSYQFTQEFLSPNNYNSKQGYEIFRKAFQDQYAQEFKISPAMVWKDVKDKRVFIAKAFLKDRIGESSSDVIFPDDGDNVHVDDESIKSFCDRFRFVCDTQSTSKLDDVIVRLWRDIHSGTDQSDLDEIGRVEKSEMLNTLFVKTFKWMKNESTKEWSLSDVEETFKNINNAFAFMKLRGISNKLRGELVKSPFKIKREVLDKSNLYNPENSIILINTHDVDFGATVLADILAVRDLKPYDILFLEDSDIISNPQTTENLFYFIDDPSALIVRCNEKFQQVDEIVKNWKTAFDGTKRQIFLIKTVISELSNLIDLHMCDLTDKSREKFLNQEINLCGTFVSASKIFKTHFLKLSIETVINLLKESPSQMKNKDKIEIQYRKIKDTYVNRCWIDFETNLKAENLHWIPETEISKLLRYIEESQGEEVRFETLTESMKKLPVLNKLFEKRNIPIDEPEPTGKKVSILLAEAGFGKSTNLSWMAWHMREKNRSAWVVRCNLPDHINDFKQFKFSSKDIKKNKIINETDALRMIYKMVHSSLQVKQPKDKKSSKCLNLFDEKVNVDENLMNKHGLPFNSSIQLLVFKEKFNAGELVLLLDGFDEISPDYKEVVLKFLSHFEKFKGVRQLYLTSRPYGFKKQFENELIDPSFFKLKPLSLLDKSTILYKVIQQTRHNVQFDDEEITDLFKYLSVIMLYHLGNKSDTPLFLRMSVDILVGYLDNSDNNENTIDTSAKTISKHIFEKMNNMSNETFIMEKFVDKQIKWSLDKIKLKKGDPRNRDFCNIKLVVEKHKMKHGLAALWVLFNETDRIAILSSKEINDAENFMKEIDEANTKFGFINGIHEGVPMFIHRSFAEYLAAWWIINRHFKGISGKKKICYLNSYWHYERYELRRHIDIMLAEHNSLHLAIIERDWENVKMLATDDLKAFDIKNRVGQTALHLLALYLKYFFDYCTPRALPSIAFDQIKTKDELFGWTALDCAFCVAVQKMSDDWIREIYIEFMFELLDNGATINVDILYELVVSSEDVSSAARCSGIVMRYLSERAIEYELHDACIKMKELCTKVVHYLVNETPAEFMNKKISILDNIINNDSAWMLQSAIEVVTNQKQTIEYVTSSINEESIIFERVFITKYVADIYPDLLNNEELHWKCIIKCLSEGYLNEFKYFFDLYCSRHEVKDFVRGQIQGNEARHDFEEDDYLKFSNFRNEICLILPTGNKISNKMLSMLTICVVAEKLSMLRYLKESCKLNFCAGLIFSVAMLTEILINKVEYWPKDSRRFYTLLLDHASNINNTEANKMLRLAIIANHYEFSKCLIDRYKIDFQAVDEVKGWNVFHLCVSNQRSFVVDNFNIPSYFKIDLFCYMLEKEKDMDGFDVLDKKARSILQIAVENGRRDIAELIVARKLGLNDIKELRNLGAEDIPNLTFCYRVIYRISKTVREKGCAHQVLCRLAKQIAKIALSIPKESQSNSGRLLLKEDAEELYQMAIKCKSLYLMYYLQREFPSAIPAPIYDADWLACTVAGRKSPNFIDVTNWLLHPNNVDQHVDLYEVVEKCDDEGYDLYIVDLEKLVKQTENFFSVNRSGEDVSKLKILALAVCLEEESMIRHLYEPLNLNMDWKDLIDVMVVVHHSHKYACGFHKSYFDPIFKYLFERASNLSDINADGRTQHISFLVVQSGSGCMVEHLIKQNLFNVTTTNQQNGWNIFHYYASRKTTWSCLYPEKKSLLACITKRVLEITSDDFPLSSLTESRRNKLNELCFNRNEETKSVIQIAVEADNIRTAKYIVEYCLGINDIDEHEIRSPVECSQFIKCYEELSEIAAQLPFNGHYDYLLHRLAKSIHRFLPENIQHITEQENVEAHIVEDACRMAIMNRSISTLQDLMIACKDQMNQALARRTSLELVVCLRECIRRNRISMFKVLIGHYRTLHGIQLTVEVEFEREENDKNNEMMIDEDVIRWSVIYESNENVVMHRGYLPLLILSVAYGRLQVIRYFVEKLQLKVNKSLILLIMKALQRVENWTSRSFKPIYPKAVVPVYEYLATISEGKPILLHLFCQAENYKFVEYLIEEKHLDPYVIYSDNGWNAGHCCVSASDANSEFVLNISKLLIRNANMNFFDVGKNKSILHMAFENGHTKILEYFVQHRLGVHDYDQLWKEQDLKKIEEHIKELKQIIEALPENIPEQQLHDIQDILEKVEDRKMALITYKQLFTNRT